MAEADEYDVIFAALKHPLRRQILLLLDEKGELSFTDIQKAVAVEDTGLMSYHLKELALLVSQSARGRYRLSEIGKSSVALLKKVERSRDVSKEVRKELSRVVGQAFWFLLICAVPWLAAVSADIRASVELMSNGGTMQVAWVYILSLLAMYGGVALFTIYDRHYFSKALRKTIIHSTFFALVVVLTLVPQMYMTYQFMVMTFKDAPVSSQHSSAIAFYGLVMLLRTIIFVVGSPFITYLTLKIAKGFFRRKT